MEREKQGEEKYDEDALVAMILMKNVILKTRHTLVSCKYCGKPDFVMRYGKTKEGKQRYVCAKCNRTFLDNKAPERMRFSTEVIASALNQFYEGASLHQIRRQLKLTYGVSPDVANIYRWVARYTKSAIRLLGSEQPTVGNKWVADETVLKLKSNRGENTWFWDIMDDKTRFLLASHMTKGRTTSAAQTLMEKAENRAKIVPKTVVTDKLQAYLDAIEKTWGADTLHIQTTPFVESRAGDSTRAIERFHGTLKDRTKVMRALADKETARVILDGWLIHYNFFRPHSGLKELPPRGHDKTPSDAAKVETDIRSWLEVIKREKA